MSKEFGDFHSLNRTDQCADHERSNELRMKGTVSVTIKMILTLDR